jgi:hypothetical protein
MNHELKEAFSQETHIPKSTDKTHQNGDSVKLTRPHFTFNRALEYFTVKELTGQ